MSILTLPNPQEMGSRRLAKWAGAGVSEIACVLAMYEVYGTPLPDLLNRFVLVVFLLWLVSIPYLSEAGYRVLLWWDTRGYNAE